jgi:hypothetical protein
MNVKNAHPLAAELRHRMGFVATGSLERQRKRIANKSVSKTDHLLRNLKDETISSIRHMSAQSANYALSPDVHHDSRTIGYSAGF